MIDYLEPIEGELYKLGDDIRKIFEKLDGGIRIDRYPDGPWRAIEVGWC